DLHFHLEGPHIDLIQPAQRLEAAVQALNSLSHPPDLVLVTGDLTENGLPEEYAEVGALLSGLHMPWLPIPSNHDNAETLRDAVPEMRCLHWGGSLTQYVIDGFTIRIVARDTGLRCMAQHALTEGRDVYADLIANYHNIE